MPQGFVAAVTHLRSFVPVIYNMTVAIPKNEPPPTLPRLFRGCSSTDAFSERHLATDTFGNDIRCDIGKPKRSLLVVICWSCLLLLAIIEFFEMYPFSWGEVAFCVIADLNLCIPVKRPTEVDDGLTDVPPFVNDYNSKGDIEHVLLSSYQNSPLHASSPALLLVYFDRRGFLCEERTDLLLLGWDFVKSEVGNVISQQKIVFLIIQFLEEEKFKESVHMLE
ncbi:hypothetical protein OROMI_000998 [Orobanche minor]